MGDMIVDLFFSQSGSSLAARIISYEAGVRVKFIEVDPTTQRTPDGTDYLEISPLGLVPALRLDDGFLLTENDTLLRHLAASSNSSNFAPPSSFDLRSLYQWLHMVGADIREALLPCFFDSKTVGRTAMHTREFVVASLDFLNVQLTGRQYLLDQFSVADAYLCALLNSTPPTRTDFSRWPAINAYYDRLLKRPSVARAMTEERVLHETQAARQRISGDLSLTVFA
jgi:glutathione S-transferase